MFGPGCTLLRFGPRVEVDALVDAAAGRSMPLAIVDVRAKGIPSAYRRALVVCRDDRHVAWRADAVPRDAATLVRRLCGDLPHDAHALHDATGSRSASSPSDARSTRAG